MPDFDQYLEVIRNAIKRGAWCIQLDKRHMLEAWGSVTSGLVFYHKIFSRLSDELDIKFYVYTDAGDTRKFIVTFHEKETPK